MDGSTQALPSDLFKLSVFDYNRDRRIPISYRKHFCTELHIVLRVQLLKSYASLVVKRASFGAMGTAGFRVYSDFQTNSPFLKDQIKQQR